VKRGVVAGRILVTGATGYLGRRVAARAAAAGWSVVGTHLATEPGEQAAEQVSETARAGEQAAEHAGERLDIRDPAAVHDLLRRVRPDAVVHTAAGRDRNDWPSTADGAANVAVAAAQLGVRLVHVSSDAIFSGRDPEYDEDAEPDPVYRYGCAKAAAETAVRAIAPQAAVVRTSLILGDGNGAHELLTHALVAGELTGALFTDEVRNPVHVDDLADALVELVGSGYRGVLNVAGADAVSRYDLGVLVALRDGLDRAGSPDRG
jgi:dTDP-4-dehydrorhamnose reductase